MDYYFEMVQKLRFAVYDIDNETSVLGDDDFLGDMECNLGQVWKLLLLTNTPYRVNSWFNVPMLCIPSKDSC